MVRHMFSLSWIFLTLLLALGCAATVPNLQPFANGTAELRTSASEGFTAAQNSLERMASLLSSFELDVPGENQELRTQLQVSSKSLHDSATRLSQARAVRVEALDGFVTYSDRLAGIAASGQSQREQATAALKAVENLAGTFTGFAPIPGVDEGVKILVDAGQKALDFLLQVRTVAKLDEAVQQADPAVKLLADALSQDLKILEGLFTTAEPAVDAAYRLRYKLLLDYYEQLLRARETLAQQRRQELAQARLGDLQDTKTVEMLRSVDKQIKAAEVWRAPFVGQRDREVQMLTTSRQLFQATQAALARWQRAHSDLAKALAESRQPSISAFAEAIQEIRTLVTRLRTLQSATPVT